MEKTKGVLKKLLIIYLIIYMVLSSMSTCFARPYDEKCGEYVAQYARDYIQKYETYPNHYNTDANPAYWTGGADGKGTFHVCCSTFVQYMYQHGLGVNIEDYNINLFCQTAYNNFVGGDSQDVEVIRDVSDLKPGDIVVRDGHMEMFIGNGETANGGTGKENGNLKIGSISNWDIGGNAIGLRFKSSVDVNPAGSVPMEEGEMQEENLSIYDENGFIYSGVAKLESYESSKSIIRWIIDKITEIIDYIIGMATYAVRAVLVGWTAIIERLVIDGIVNAVTGVKNERVDNWQKDPNTIDPDENVIEILDNTATQPEATGKLGDEEYVSEGMQSIADIGDNVQLKTSSEANVTIENIVYNKIPILDINFFNFESAGGAVVDENGIIYIIKENVALWYYVFRIIAIIVMLLILIYTGIKIAISTIAETKATYKKMLVAWIAGFLLMLAVHYIMYYVISINESLISWVTPKYESGMEISLYESVRTKAYEIKASTGFAGMIMYMVLVFYTIKFLIMYFKRLITIIILSVISPFVVVVHVIEKVSKNASKSGKVFGMWLKDYIYTVLLQAMHALIFTVFISTILDLTETSLVGIFIALLVMNFMFKADKIFRKVLGFSGKNVSKLEDEPLLPKVLVAKEGINQTKKMASFYGNQLRKPLNSISSKGTKLGATVSNKYNQVKDKFRYSEVDSNLTKEEKEKKIKEEIEKKYKKQQKRQETAATIGGALSASATLVSAIAKGAITIPLLVAEPKFGIYMINSTMKSSELLSKKLKALNIDSVIPKTARNGKKYKVKGIKARTQASAMRLVSRLGALGAKVRIVNQINEENLNNPNNGYRPQSRPKTNTKITISNLKLAKGKIDVEDIKGIDGVERYKEIIIEAEKKEEELELMYKELIEELDKQIKEVEGINPEFVKELKEKKAKEVLRTSKLLSKPISEKDILQAIQNYKTKDPTFNANIEELEQKDIEGITKEIDLILGARDGEFQMSKKFLEKIQKEVVENHRKIIQDRERREKTREISGQDVSDKGKNVVVENKKDIKEKTRTVNVDDRRNGYAKYNEEEKQQQYSATERLDPNAKAVQGKTSSNVNMSQYSSRNINSSMANHSPHDVEKNSSLDKLVENISNASKGTDSKETRTIPKRSIEFSRKIDELKKLSEEAQEITGEELYDLDDIYKRLENL